MANNKGKHSNKFSSIFKNFAELLSPSLFLPLGGTELIVEAVIKAIADKSFFIKGQEDNIEILSKEASKYLNETSRILEQLQNELNNRNQQLEKILTTINERKDEAQHYAELANLNKKTADAFTKEIEKRVREQIRAELERGKVKRRIVGAILWTITLINP